MAVLNKNCQKTSLRLKEDTCNQLKREEIHIQDKQAKRKIIMSIILKYNHGRERMFNFTSNQEMYIKTTVGDILLISLDERISRLVIL